MRKIRKGMTAVALSLAMGLTTAGIPGGPVMEVHAEVTPDSSISLSDASTVTADTAGSVLRIYGDGSTVYDVPIHVMADCTVLLDNISDAADLTVETGVTANIVVCGSCSLGNIVAAGGEETKVAISGEDAAATLTTGNIAQAKAGQMSDRGIVGEPETGASVDIEGCTVSCDNIGCGNDGLVWSYDWFGDGSITYDASDAGQASPAVTIRRAAVHAGGSIACGGNGIVYVGENCWLASDGGSAGDVMISDSHVTAGGSMSIGGKGGDGSVRGAYTTAVAGNAASSGNVWVMDGSVAEVAGDVATAPDLADESYVSEKEGLSGGMVIVERSSLSCRDIASGGCGIGKTFYSATTANTTYHGTAGGPGGLLVAKNAVIRCETACNGGEAGDYYKKTIVSEASYEGHPKDGNGGRIEAANSRITITDTACKRAMKWDGYGGSRSSHSTSLFSGGSLTGGTVYGRDIVTDLTAVEGCELVPDYRVANSEGENVFRCILHTSEEMAGETVSVSAKIIAGTSFLNDSGQLVTYLAMGTNEVRITGTKIYAGTCLVETDPSANEFFLELAGIPETPDDGGQEIPGMGEEGTPGIGDEGTPDNGGEETPGAGGEGTPDDGGEETPGAGGEGTPDNGGEEAPGTVGEEKPGSGGEETPGTGGEEAPGTGSEETPPVTGYEMVVSTNVPGIAVTVFAGEQTLDLQADENGTVRFMIAPDVTEFYVIVDAVKYCCPVTDGIPGGLVMMGPTAVLSGNGMLREGDLLQLTVDAAPSIEGNTLSYEWYKDGAALEAGGSVFTVPHAALSDAGSYYVVVTESNGQCVSTAALTVSVEAGEETGGSSGSSSGGSTGGSSGGDLGSSGGASTGGSGGGDSGSSGSVSTGGSGGGSLGGLNSGSTSGSSGGASSQNPADEPTADSPEKQEETGSPVSAIQVKPNQKGIALLPASAKNTYQKYFAKTVKLTVEKEPGVTYYYKVVKKGRADSSVKWKKLTGNVIRAAASDTAKRICIKAVDQTGASVVRKTSGFYVDSKKPAVKGVKNKAVYTKPVKIQFSDNISVKAATLNGKKVKNGCKVSKNGTYRLVVTDRAGNKKTVRFTINK